MNTRKPNKRSVSWTGILLIVIGALLLLETLDIFEIGIYLRDWWPALLILFGIIKLRESNKAGAIFFIVVGAVLLSLTLNLLSWESMRFFWPLVIIAIGVFIIWNRNSTNRDKERVDSSDTIQARALFGGFERRVSSRAFQGGIIEALFGGVEIDLSKSELSPEGAHLDISAIFGGVEIRIPEDWKVNLNGIPIFGGIDAKTQIPTGTEGEAVMECKCLVIFGGIEIKQ